MPASYRSLVFYLLAILLGIYSIYAVEPHYSAPENAPDSVFSAGRARKFMDIIANRPHMTGTAEHALVRDTILAFCDSLKLETSVDTGYGMRTYKNYTIGARVHNILARLKGTDSAKAVYVVAHYDSEPNTLGAGDDGAGVSAMMESIRALKASGRTFKNDIVFLFTDAEEEGLLGATAFSKDTALSKNLGVVLNYDGSAIRGLSMMTETSSENGELIRLFSQLPHPIGSSLSGEVKKIVLGDTDFSIFKNAGFQGLNFTLVEGRSHYHSLIDLPGYFDLRTLQQHGENMLAMIRLLGNSNPGQLKAPDQTYFNILPNSLMHYAAANNIWWLILCDVLFLLCIIIYIREEIKATGTWPLRSWFLGTAVFLVVLLLVPPITTAFIKWIQKTYPHNNIFYNSEAYNTWLYYVAIGSLAIFLFGIIYAAIRRFVTLRSMQAGFYTVTIAVVHYLYTLFPAAIYFLLFPLLFALIVSCIIWRLPKDALTSWKEDLIVFAGTLPAMLLMPSIIYLVFATMGLSSGTVGPPLLLVFLLGFLLYFWRGTERRYPWWLAAVGLMGVVTSVLLAHASAGFDARRPQHSSLFYRMDADAQKAWWISEFHLMDAWNQKYLGTNPELHPADTSAFPNIQLDKGQLRSEAKTLEIFAPEIQLFKDSTVDGKRFLQLKCHSNRQAQAIRIVFENGIPVNDLKIQGLPVHAGSDSSNRRIQFVGMNDEPLNLSFSVAAGQKIPLYILDYTVGIPPSLETVIRPDFIIPSHGWNSNSTQVIKHYSF